MVLRRRDRLGKDDMAAPLVTRDPEGFTVSHGEILFSGLAFVVATWVAKAAAAGQDVFACSWAYEGLVPDFDGGHWGVLECGAPAVADERGFECAAGHAHVSMQARHDEGWDYFEDDEIQGMKDGQFFPGIGVRDMAGRVVI